MKWMVRWRGVRTATQRGKSSSGLYGGIVHIGYERNPLMAVGLVLVHITFEVLSQHTMASRHTPFQFGMKRSRLNFLDLKDLAGVSKHFANVFSAFTSL